MVTGNDLAEMTTRHGGVFGCWRNLAVVRAFASRGCPTVPISADRDRYACCGFSVFISNCWRRHETILVVALGCGVALAL